MNCHFSTERLPDGGVSGPGWLNAGGLELFSTLGSFLTYPPGIQLIRQGSSAYEVYFVDRGLVKLDYLAEDGEERIVGLRNPGSLIGAGPVILGRRHPQSATTVTPCSLLRIPADLFIHHIQTDPAASWAVHEECSRELYQLTSQVTALACSSPRSRLTKLLAQLASATSDRESNGEIRLFSPLRQWELAQIISVTPQHLSKMLKQMEDEGLVRREKGCLIIGRDLFQCC
jgi:CRP-like cAMP-binding protein